MKKSIFAFFCCLAAVGVFGVNATAAVGPYFSIQGGATWVQDADFDYDLPSPFSISGESEFDTGFNIGLAGGYDYGLARLEAEVAYRENDFDKLKANISGFGSPLDGTFEGSVDGEINSLSFMVNGFLDFENETSVTPYLGAGLGVANVEVKGDDFDDDDDTVFAYQFAAGLAFAVSPYLSLDLGYRYFATEDPEFDDDVVGASYDNEYQTHNASLGLRMTY